VCGDHWSVTSDNSVKVVKAEIAKMTITGNSSYQETDRQRTLNETTYHTARRSEVPEMQDRLEPTGL